MRSRLVADEDALYIMILLFPFPLDSYSHLKGPFSFLHSGALSWGLEGRFSILWRALSLGPVLYGFFGVSVAPS